MRERLKGRGLFIDYVTSTVMMGGFMSNFEEIKSQEQLDKIISERLKRQKEKYADYDELLEFKKNSESRFNVLNDEIEQKNREIAQKDKSIDVLKNDYESLKLKNLKVKVAMKNGIPYDLASRLRGSNEDELTEYCRSLKGYFKVSQPLRNTEPVNVGPYENLVKNLNLED